MKAKTIYIVEYDNGDGNLPWLVALALDFGKGVHPPSKVTALYSPND